MSDSNENLRAHKSVTPVAKRLFEMWRSFEDMVDDYYQPAYRFALVLTGNQSDACEVTRQAFCLMVPRKPRFGGAPNAKLRLFTALYREYLRVRRPASAPLPTDHERSNSWDTPFMFGHANEFDGATVLVALQSLEENFRPPTALFYLRQHSCEEIGVILDLPVHIVLSRIAKGKAMLRQHIESRCSTEHAR